VKGRFRRPALAILALVAAGALLIAACGGDEDDETTIGVAPVSATVKIDAGRAFIDSLGSYPSAVLVREYVTTGGAVGREYGTFIETAQAASEIGVFYRDKLKSKGWETTQEHAAVSVYSKGNQTLSVMRYGATTPTPAADQTTIVTARHAVELKFFFAVEAGLKS
jgi:hypothetical protein